VHAGHDVLDRPVLAGGVHRLEDDQQRIAVVGVEQVLGAGQVGEVLVEDLPGPLFERLLAELLHLLGLRPAGAEILDPDLLPRGRPEPIDDVVPDHGWPPTGFAAATGSAGIATWGCPSATAGAGGVGRGPRSRRRSPRT